jgi:hypothetical protein
LRRRNTKIIIAYAHKNYSLITILNKKEARRKQCREVFRDVVAAETIWINLMAAVSTPSKKRRMPRERRLAGEGKSVDFEFDSEITLRGRQKINPIFCWFVLGLKPGKAWLQTV